MTPLARPLALGAATALGIATVLSEPPKFTAPGSTIAPTANMKSGTGGADLGYGEHPHEHIMGNPSTHNLVQSQHAVRLRPNEPSGYRVDIRGTTGQNTNMSNINSQIRSALGSRTRINSSIRDMRSSLTPQRISSILQDE
jgi:hypothetical protein